MRSNRRARTPCRIWLIQIIAQPPRPGRARNRPHSLGRGSGRSHSLAGRCAPSSMQITRSATSSARARRSCSTSIVVTPLRIKRFQLLVDLGRRRAAKSPQRNLVKQQQVRVGHQRRGRSPSPAARPQKRLPARLPRRACKLGNRTSNTVSIFQAPVRLAARAKSKFSSTLMRANKRRPSGTKRDAGGCSFRARAVR